MAASLTGIFDDNLREKIKNARILVVGAGGIGCELLKNLVLTGFLNIEIIDLDTIDVSNLNRQFLFHKQHVGKSKALVAANSAIEFNPNVAIDFYHDSIVKKEYSVSFIERFTVVLSALDNINARFHVNRLCLAANVPLIESGTSGYLGQVELIKKGITSCYECLPRRRPKDIASCTIRNTPSEPIHCVVWSKHLFNQLFGEADDEDDVSPDVMDPELANEPNLSEDKKQTRVNTRQWVKLVNYDPRQIFKKVFYDDILYLLDMATLWEGRGRKKPTPLNIDSAPDSVPGSSKDKPPSLKDMAIWSIKECVDVFISTTNKLKKRLDENNGVPLVWDKDDNDAMDFVVASTNIRAHIFKIPEKSRFEIKSTAGNIIPAIATTNAVIAGVVVLKTLNVLQEQLHRCTSVYLRRDSSQGKTLADEKILNGPNPVCIACRTDAVVQLSCDVNSFTVKELEELILKKDLKFAAPDVRLKSTYFYIISSEEGETEDNNNKTLSEMGVFDNEVLQAEDDLQNYALEIKIRQYKAEEGEPDYLLSTEGVDLNPQEEVKKNGDKPEDKSMDVYVDDDDLEIIDNDYLIEPNSLKRKLSDDEVLAVPTKKRIIEEQDDCIMIG